jgi:hypothetical protein
MVDGLVVITDEKNKPADPIQDGTLNLKRDRSYMDDALSKRKEWPKPGQRSIDIVIGDREDVWRA